MRQVVDLGFRPRDWQAGVFLALARFSILVIHRGAGKTYLAILKLIDEALRCDHDRGVYGYIAPYLKQAKGIAWEILKGYARLVPGTRINEAELWVEFANGARIRILGADNIDTIRGLHFSGVVIDEVKDINRDLWTLIILPALANRNGWAVFIGTPCGINLLSELYYAAVAGNGWCYKLMTCFDTGVFTSEQIAAMRKPIEQGGMGERAFRQEMLCDFMASSDDTLVSIEEARAAYGRLLREEQYVYAPKIIGVDVAWQGGDRSVIFPRQGLAAFKPVIRQGLPEKQFAAELADIWSRWQPDSVFVDNTGGYGGEVVSRLLDNGYNPQGVIFSEAPANPRFLNKRAEMWFKMADWVKQGGSISEDDENGVGLLSELCAPKYDNDNASNKLRLESKADIKDRLGFSVDQADALALTFAFPVLPKPEYGGVPSRVKVAECEWNPIANRRA